MQTRFEKVSFSYGSVHALTDVSFTVPTGQTVALLGANGAGKSTAVDLMLGLRRPHRGTVTVLGGQPAAAVAAGRVGAMLQTGGLPADSTVGEVVDLARCLYGKRRTLASILDLAGLTELQRRRVDRLSGGQAQRVRFAVAMAGKPDLLFLDEPTVALDFKARRQFWKTVKSEGNTVVFATHYLDEADEYADRVIVIDRGRVVADGEPAVIKGDSSLEHALVELTEEEL
ncbi:ABC-2 type transport system ATP-binding protein [Kibdelosporangium banguiense]|uniref:ABC-2 type transport system ATP-binding protein n=1 Tax=Kibdelosporangium banguiense TaxID=1365924 RepID=A0ABS4T9H8_9PSEU|nr:ABC transporter ATP-binding protein [Kibdelosporangium banguiense]MBP2321078.1 ABC-2 type transport system ATP-binding protein [Kibdelosporangium banguiense]